MRYWKKTIAPNAPLLYVPIVAKGRRTVKRGQSHYSKAYASTALDAHIVAVLSMTTNAECACKQEEQEGNEAKKKIYKDKKKNKRKKSKKNQKKNQKKTKKKPNFFF